MTQQLEHTVVFPSPTALPELWVVCVAKANMLHDLSEILRFAGVAPDRTVLVSDSRLPLMSTYAEHMMIGGDQPDSVLWNAGLSRIRRLHPTSSPGCCTSECQWDVLLLNPEMPLSHRAVDSLRVHMRTVDTWMAEPDAFSALTGRQYRTVQDLDYSEVPPSTVVVAGEQGVLFNPRIWDSADAWVEYCRRTRHLGGSVQVSARSMRELV